MRLVEDTRRRVGRLAAARADPIGVEDSRAEMPVDDVRVVEAGELPEPVEPAAASCGSAGAPQTLQYPSSISPEHPG
jgi:hypothetical protein